MVSPADVSEGEAATALRGGRSLALAVLCFAAFAQRTIYLDVALWLASFSYLGAIIWSRYLEREFL